MYSINFGYLKTPFMFISLLLNKLILKLDGMDDISVLNTLRQFFVCVVYTTSVYKVYFELL